MLEKGHITAPFAGGINEKATPQLLQDGMQAVVSNGVFTKDGSIRKRWGSKKLGTSPASPAFKLNTLNAELVAACNDNQIRSYSNTTFTGNNWVTKNFAPEAVAQRFGLPTQVSGVHSYDMIVNGTIACIAWIASTAAAGAAGDRVFATVVDMVTGAIIRPLNSFVGGGGVQQANPKVVYSTNGGGTFVLLWSEPATTTIYASKIAVNNVAGWSAPVLLRNDCVAGRFDAAVLSGIANRSLMFYESTNAAFPASVVLLDTTTPSVAAAVASAAPDTGFSGVAISRSTDIADTTYWLGYAIVIAGNMQTKTFGVNPALVVTAGYSVALAQPLRTGSVAAGVGGARVSMVRTGNTPPTAIVMTGTAPGAAAAVTTLLSRCTIVNNAPSAQIDTYRLQLTSNLAIFPNGRIYFTGFYCDVSAFSPVRQCTGWLFEITQPALCSIRAVCTFANLVCTSIVNANNAAEAIYQQTCNLVPLSTGHYVTLTDASVINAHTTLQIVDVDPNQAYLQNGAEFGHDLNLSGGVPSYYDSANTAEIGFMYFPPSQPTFVVGAAGTGNMDAGTYSYRAVYEWYDAAGQYHQSNPGPAAVTGAVAATGSVTVTVPCLNITQREGGSSVGIAIYRAGPLAGGFTVHYRVEAENLPSTSLNVQGAEFITLAPDTRSRAGVDSNRPLYTEGGTLGHFQPPSATVAIVHRDRLWLAGTDDPRFVWYSASLSDGEAAWFTPAFRVQFPDPIVALASMDGTLVAFSRTGLFVVSGDGPADNGTGNDLTSPQRINSPSGCVDPRSVVRTADGILFQSEGGIYMLSRSQEVTYYGKNVEDTLAAYPLVTSAVVMEDQGQQRWTFYNTLFGTSTVVVFDDVQKAWSTFTYADGASPIAPIAAIKWGSNGYVYSAGASVYIEDQSTHLDNSSTWVTLTIKSNWFKPQPNQGFGRFWRVMALLQGVSDHDVTMTLAYNYNSTIVDTRSWAILKNGILDPGGIEQLAVNPTKSLCESMQVTISDGTPTAQGTSLGLGTGFYAIALDLEIGVKQGSFRLPAAARL